MMRKIKVAWLIDAPDVTFCNDEQTFCRYLSTPDGTCRLFRMVSDNTTLLLRENETQYRRSTACRLAEGVAAGYIPSEDVM